MKWYDLVEEFFFFSSVESTGWWHFAALSRWNMSLSKCVDKPIIPSSSPTLLQFSCRLNCFSRNRPVMSSVVRLRGSDEIEKFKLKERFHRKRVSMAETEERRRGALWTEICKSEIFLFEQMVIVNLCYHRLCVGTDRTRLSGTQQ